MGSEAVHVERHDAVLLIRIDRPHKGNTIDGAVTAGLAAALQELDETPELRVGLLTGTGTRHFCLGSDLGAVQGGDRELIHPVGGYAGVTRYPRVKPLVAALNGDAVGGGLEIALACDFALAADTARLGFPEVRIGVIAGGGGLVRLPRQIPVARAAELLLTGRLIGADESEAIGLIARAVQPDALMDAAWAVVDAIASASPAAVCETRALLRHAATLGEDELWRHSDAALERVLAGPDAAEGRQAFLDKRPAVWAQSASGTAASSLISPTPKG